MKYLLRLYPSAWRRRYGEEFEALLEEQRLGPRQVIDILRGALDARLRTDHHLAVQRELTVAIPREELRDELHAILAAREELGPEHEQHLVESLLDRLEPVITRTPPPSRRRLPRRSSALLAAGSALVIASVVQVQHATQARPLGNLNVIAGAPDPRLFAGAPIYHYSRTISAYLDWRDTPNAAPAFQFWFRYTNCPRTAGSAFTITLYRSEANAAPGHVVPVGSVSQYSLPYSDWQRSDGVQLEFLPHGQAIYYWKVEVPTLPGCTWQLSFSTS